MSDATKSKIAEMFRWIIASAVVVIIIIYWKQHKSPASFWFDLNRITMQNENVSTIANLEKGAEKIANEIHDEDIFDFYYDFVLLNFLGSSVLTRTEDRLLFNDLKVEYIEEKTQFSPEYLALNKFKALSYKKGMRELRNHDISSTPTVSQVQLVGVGRMAVDTVASETCSPGIIKLPLNDFINYLNYVIFLDDYQKSMLLSKELADVRLVIGWHKPYNATKKPIQLTWPDELRPNFLPVEKTPYSFLVSEDLSERLYEGQWRNGINKLLSSVAQNPEVLPFSLGVFIQHHDGTRSSLILQGFMDGNIVNIIQRKPEPEHWPDPIMVTDKLQNMETLLNTQDDNSTQTIGEIFQPMLEEELFAVQQARNASDHKPSLIDEDLAEALNRGDSILRKLMLTYILLGNDRPSDKIAESHKKFLRYYRRKSDFDHRMEEGIKDKMKSLRFDPTKPETLPTPKKVKDIFDEIVQMLNEEKQQD